MTQLAYLETGKASIQIEFPSEETELMSGIPWGNIAGFPTIAYWAYRVLQRRLEHKTIQYKLGRTLLEETAACLLGGHGIPASMGLAAFEHLRDKNAFSGEIISEDKLYMWLSEPIKHNNKLARYRFAKQKAKYLHSAIIKLSQNAEPKTSGRELRDWLMNINGIGPKTASWIVRNWMDANDVAILDIHLYRAGLLGKFFPKEMTIEKNYFDLEERFLAIADAINVNASELDAVIWHEMQNSSRVMKLLNQFYSETESSKLIANKSYTYSKQLALV